MTMYATKTYGFTPREWPVVAFSVPGWRRKLLETWTTGDTMLIVATQGKPTPAGQRGRILGYLEFLPVPMATIDLADLDSQKDAALKKDLAVPAIRAWRITDPPVFKRLLPNAADSQRAAKMRQGFEALTSGEEAKIRALSVIEVPLDLEPAVVKAAEERGLIDLIEKQRGPSPAGDVAYTVDRRAGAAATYLLKWPSHGIMKVGRSADPASRALDLSQPLAPDLTGEQWQVVLTEQWPDEKGAHIMEQAFIDELDRHGIDRSGEYFTSATKDLSIERDIWHIAKVSAEEAYKN